MAFADRKRAERRSGPLPCDLTWIARYMPIPFVERARGFRGADCRGLAYLILEHEAGIYVPEPDQPPTGAERRSAPEAAAFVRAQAALWRPVQPDADGGYPRFTLLLFTVGGLPTHVGLSLGGRDFIHTQKGCGVRTGSLDEAEAGQGFWGSNLEGAYTYGG